MYCVVCMSAGAYKTNRLARAGSAVDAAAIALIAVSAFFGLFSSTMAMLSLRFCFINSTNIESLLPTKKVYQLAIRIPLRQTPPGSDATSTTNTDYETVTFPLAEGLNGGAFAAAGAEGAHSDPQPRAPAPEHKFAIVKTEMGDNPWDLGSYFANFKSVMGSNVLDWLLPLRMSPCCAYNDEYPMGPAVDRLRERLKQ